MFEAGLWVVGFVLFFGATWIVGKHHSERSAIRRTLKRRGHDDEAQLFEEQNNTELQLRLENGRDHVALEGVWKGVGGSRVDCVAYDLAQSADTDFLRADDRSLDVGAGAPGQAIKLLGAQLGSSQLRRG